MAYQYWCYWPVSSIMVSTCLHRFIQVANNLHFFPVSPSQQLCHFHELSRLVQLGQDGTTSYQALCSRPDTPVFQLSHKPDRHYSARILLWWHSTVAQLRAMFNPQIQRCFRCWDASGVFVSCGRSAWVEEARWACSNECPNARKTIIATMFSNLY